MARGIARMGDLVTGVCFCHRNPIATGGAIVTGDFDVLVDARPVARFGDYARLACGHSGEILGFSFNVDSSKRGVARKFDIVGGGCFVGSITTASETTELP